jgi:hypothetical protein
MQKLSHQNVTSRICDFIIANSKVAAEESKANSSRPGLWANIRAKRKRGEKPAQPGDEDYPDSENWSKLTKDASVAYLLNKMATEAWQRSEGQNPEGGLNAKGRSSYNRATGGDLKAPVTQKNPKGKAKARRKSFCSRMEGMKKKLTSSETANDPDSRINKALRKWRC